MRRTRGMRLAAMAGAGALVLTGCLQSDEETSGSASDTAEGDGEVSIIGAFADAEADAFEKSLVPFEEESGIDVTYTPSTDFTTEISTRIQGGDPPEIALFPQPGLVLELGESGDAIPLNDLIDFEPIEQTIVEGFLDAVTDGEGNVYAVPMRAAVKSLVWYPKKAFEEAGYAVPKTWDELEALQEQIKADGTTPWCIGAEAGADTGWVYTDWVEEMMLRTAGPDTYDQWWQHEIPFDDESVVTAGEAFGEIIFTDGYVFGGPQGSLTTAFGDADDPMWESDPGCYLMRNGNFITGFFPDDIQANLDEEAGVFVLPPMTDAGYDGTPVLGGGDMAAAFVNDSDVVEVMEFLGSDQFGGPWADAGGWLSPHTTFDDSQYPDETTREVAAILTSADVFRFDASDLMPGEVGAGSFWKQMNAWVGGDVELEAALANIEESWPS